MHVASVPDGFRPLRLPASGFLEVNGPFHARWDGQRFVLGVRIEARHCNAGGVCHGGMLATLCDMLLTIGSNIQSGQSRFLPTVSLNCDFLAPAPLGAWIEGRLDVLRVTHHLLFASGLLEVVGQGLIARTSGVMKIGGEVDARFAPDCYFDPLTEDPPPTDRGHDMSPSPSRRAAMALAGLCMLAVTGHAFADYPTRPIAVIVSGPPGGPLDVVTRTVFNKVSDGFAQQGVIIENRAGAGGILAVSGVTRAAPDGYTLLSTIDPPIVATPSLVKSVPYDPLKDLMPVAMLGDGGDNVLVVPADSPAKTVRELIAFLQASPEKANYASSGNGGPGHLLGELFNRRAGTAAVHIPHKGSPDALNALITSRVTFGFIPVGLALPYVNAGKLRPLAIAATEHNPLMPTLPTVAEAGVKDFNPAHWWIIAFAPAKTPADVVTKLNGAIRAALLSPDVVEVLRKQALRPSQDSPEKVAERVRADVAYWSRVIKELGITTD